MFKIVRRHSYFFLTTILTITTFLVAGVALLETSSGGNVLSNFVSTHSVGLLLIRLILYGTLIGFWPQILKLVVKQEPDKKNNNRYLTILLIAIAVYEVVIVQRLPIRIFNLVSG